MSKQHNITVIAGLSGVGKTYIVEKLKKASSRLVHFSAGSLIKKRRETMSRDQLRLLNPNKILQNQYLLIEELHKELKTVPTSNPIIFDAHMIIDTTDEILEIPFNVFEKLNPSRFIFLYDDPEVILKRRISDSSRTRPERSINQIKEQQNRSIDIAQNYADRLTIPLLSVTCKDLEAIKKILSN